MQWRGDRLFDKWCRVTGHTQAKDKQKRPRSKARVLHENGQKWVVDPNVRLQTVKV